MVLTVVPPVSEVQKPQILYVETSFYFVVPIDNKKSRWICSLNQLNTENFLNHVSKLPVVELCM